MDIFGCRPGRRYRDSSNRAGPYMSGGVHPFDAQRIGEARGGILGGGLGGRHFARVGGDGLHLGGERFPWRFSGFGAPGGARRGAGHFPCRFGGEGFHLGGESYPWRFSIFPAQRGWPSADPIVGYRKRSPRPYGPVGSNIFDIGSPDSYRHFNPLGRSSRF